MEGKYSEHITMLTVLNDIHVVVAAAVVVIVVVIIIIIIIRICLENR